MRLAPVICTLSALAVFSLPMFADMPIDFRLPFSVNAGDKTVPPGNYELRRLGESPYVFSLYNEDQGEYEALLMARPSERPNPAAKTDVILRSDGHEYVMDRLQIAGRQYRYQFSTPPNVMSLEKERAASSQSGS